MVLYEYGIPAIAPCSENEFLSEAQYERIKARFNHVIVNYDQDRPGCTAMIKLREKYPELEFAFFLFMEEIKISVIIVRPTVIRKHWN
jgi:DNA primase